MSILRGALRGSLYGPLRGAFPTAGLAPLFDWRADLAAPIPAGFGFTRASARKLFNGAAFVDFSSGAIPLVAGTNKGYSPDAARTNLIFHSSNFTDNGASTAGWDVSGTVGVTSLGADAIGLPAYDFDCGGGASAVHAIFTRTDATVNAGNYVFLVTAAFVDRAFMYLRGADPSAYAKLIANLQAGTISATSTSLTPTVARTTALVSGWQNVELGWTSPGVAAAPNVVIGLNVDGTNIGASLPAGFSGDNTSFKLGHAQVERTDDNIGAVSTSPIVTSGASAARAADVLSGSSGVGITPATFQFDTAFKVPAVIPTGKRVVALAAGSNVALIQVTDAGLISMFDGTTTTTIAGDERGNSVAVSVSFDGTTLRMAKNLTDEVALVPAASPVGQPIQIGHQAGDRQLRDWIHRVTLWDRPL